MADPISTALSGLMAGVHRVSQAASNIANAGSLAAHPGESEAAGAFVPRDVVQRSVVGGGVVTESVARNPASLLVFDPTAPDAAADGTLAVPNVDFAAEAVEMMTARAAYRASAAVIETVDEMERDAVDITT